MDPADLKNSFIDLKNIRTNLKSHLHKNITQSVVDLVSCYFCLDKVKNPLLCPKCHNFACKECLKRFFGTEVRKKCALCKQDISFSELQENKIITEIEKILSTNKSQKTTVDEFAKVINEKKEYYQKEQTGELNNIITKFIEYQTCLEKYKNGFNEYLSDCQRLVEKTFNDYYQEIQELINSLLTYSENCQKAIDKYDEIYNKAKENFFNNENIKELINEILYLEKKQINTNDKLEAKNFLLAPLSFKPYFKNHNIFGDKTIYRSYYSNMLKRSLYLGDVTLKISNENKVFKFELKVILIK